MCDVQGPAAAEPSCDVQGRAAATVVILEFRAQLWVICKKIQYIWGIQNSCDVQGPANPTIFILRKPKIVARGKTTQFLILSCASQDRSTDMGGGSQLRGENKYIPGAHFEKSACVAK